MNEMKQILSEAENAYTELKEERERIRQEMKKLTAGTVKPNLPEGEMIDDQDIPF